MEERLQKFLANAGVASRRSCEGMIVNGLVKVNDRVVTELGTKVDPERDQIVVGGERITACEAKVYYILYKPRGYVSTLHDERDRKKVVDLLKGVGARVYPVGRLDYDSEGLLLLTNDGALTYALTHPKHQITKTYLVRVEGVPTGENILKLARGIVLEDGPTAPAEVRLVGSRDNKGLLEIIIHEGRNRQVRRMCEAIGHRVIRLQRTKVGPLALHDMKPGQFRPLSRNELRELFSAAGLKLPRAEAPAQQLPAPPPVRKSGWAKPKLKAQARPNRSAGDHKSKK